MKLSNRRIALLTGASVSTFGLAVPAFAATTTSPGISHVVGPAGVVNDTLTICAATSTCFFGVEATNSPAATAIVNSVPTGRIEQIGSGGEVDLVMLNLGNAEIGAHASATSVAGTAAALAQINTAIIQSAVATGFAAASFTNTGQLLIDAIANASAPAGNAFATATIDFGLQQLAVGATAAAAFYSNAATVAYVADAHAAAAGFAQANATAADVQYQIVTATTVAAATFVNAGLLLINAHASAAGSAASAHAFAEYLVEQDVSASSLANAVIAQSGTAILAATATALATSGAAVASATANEAFVQEVESEGGALASITNSGTLDIHAGAIATGGTSAAAFGLITEGIAQEVEAESGALARILNSGTIAFSATASAVATGLALAVAEIEGIIQEVAADTAVLQFTNSGLISASANAFASGAAAFAFAAVTEHSGVLVGDGSAVIANSGTMSAVANATAPGGIAVATAVGIRLAAETVGTGTTFEAGAMSGTVSNAGILNVVARASGGTFTTATGGGGTTTVFLDSAIATGIDVVSGPNNLVINNSGVIIVDAITNGGPASATGIRVSNNGTFGAAGDVTTINNSGDILVSYSTDGGATFHRGTAIDVTAAPNATVINLMGGSITGDINVAAGDQINVTDDETFFNGVIGAACFTSAHLAGGDLPLLSSCGVGTLAINNQGNLHLAIDPVDGPSYVFVDTFDMTPLLGGTGPGTITFDLPAVVGTADPGTYPQVFADTAILDGNLVANIQPANGLFASSFYDNVIDANARSGTFDSCGLAGPFTNSLLLDLDCIYEDGNVDLALTRIAFDAVPGLNQNGRSVGFGLECIYSTSLTGGIAHLLADLFLFTDPVNYNTALNMLAGEGYANYLQSFPSLGVHYNDLIDHATNCEVPALAGSILECRASSPIHMWGQLDYQWRKADGDSEAGTMKARRFTGLIGVDARVANSMIVGISAGYVTNNTRTNRFNEKMDGSGFQVGLYGAYDPGQFYVKAVGTYSSLSGDSRRSIDFTGLAPGATFAGTTNGEPDVRMWTFGLHGGYRIGMGDNSVLTPYLNYDYVNAKLKSFTETGLDGANLTVYGGRARHSFLTAGVKWATQFGGVVPEVNLGYRHRFGEKRSDFRAAFLGDEHCAFDIISASQKRGTFLAGLSVGGKMGPVDLRIGYEGEFNSDITSHSGNFKIVVPFGGRAAPPPPPPAPVVAPPPPPVEVAPPPPPPAPPPPPVERGERG